MEMIIILKLIFSIMIIFIKIVMIMMVFVLMIFNVIYIGVNSSVIKYYNYKHNFTSLNIILIIIIKNKMK